MADLADPLAYKAKDMANQIAHSSSLEGFKLERSSRNSINGPNLIAQTQNPSLLDNRFRNSLQQAYTGLSRSGAAKQSQSQFAQKNPHA